MSVSTYYFFTKINTLNDCTEPLSSVMILPIVLNLVDLIECNSWYRSEGGKGNRIVGLWPGSTLHAIETYRAPRWEDYEYESLNENRLRWIGNGWSVTHMEGGGDPAFYLEPNVVDVPPAGRPEEDLKLKGRPFSH